MNINKLTITPLSKGWPQVIIDRPSIDSAGRLIKEKLSSSIAKNNQTSRVFRKIPKQLKGLVNPQCKVSTERKFSTIG